MHQKTDGRWRLGLSKLEFNVGQRVCIKHQAADELPRLLADGEDTTDLKDPLQVQVIVSANKAKRQKKLMKRTTL